MSEILKKIRDKIDSKIEDEKKVAKAAKKKMDDYYENIGWWPSTEEIITHNGLLLEWIAEINKIEGKKISKRIIERELDDMEAKKRK